MDNYLQQGYKLDVHSARQVGLVLQVDTYKTGEPVLAKVEADSTDVKVETKADEEVKPNTVTPNVVAPDTPKETETTAEEIKTSVEQETEDSVEDVSAENTLVEPTETENVPVEPISVEGASIEPEKPTKKSTTTRSKKTAQ